MIKFHSIALENFMTYEDTGLDYAHKGLILVDGENLDHMYADSNLSGKTNLMVEALLWCLFEQGLKEKGPDGNTVSQYRKDDVVMNGKDECEVLVEFSKDGSYYELDRTKKRNGISDLQLRKDGDVIKGKSKAHTQEIVNSVLGMSYVTASQTLMFGQGTRRFSQAKDSERKLILEELLSLGIFGDALKEVRDRKKGLKSNIISIEKDLVAAKTSAEQWWQWRDEAIHDYLIAVKKIKSWKKDIQSKKQKVLETVKDIKANIKKRKGPLKKLTVDVPELEALEKKLAARKKKLEDKILPIWTKARMLEDRLEGIVDEDVAECPTCLQDIEEGHLTKVVKDTDRAVDKTRKVLAPLHKKSHAVQSELGVVRQSLHDHRDTLQRESYHQEVDEQTVKNKLKDAKGFDDLKPPQEADKSKMDKAEDKLATAQEEVKGVEKELKVLNKKLEDLEFWEVGFGNRGIKSLMLDSVLPVLNAEANKYINHLMDDIEIEFDTETQTKGGESRDSFEVRVRSGNSQGYHLASGGERRRIDFCISLALQSLLASTGSKSNIFILDEPFESVDESGRGELVDLLREYGRKQKVAVYCITHLSNMKPLFDDIVTVRRKNGVSQVA